MEKYLVPPTESGGVTITFKQGKALRVLGLDVSTKTGAVMFDRHGKIVVQKELALKPLKNGSSVHRMYRAVELFHTVRDLVVIERPELVVFEGYGYANAHTLAVLVELGAMARHACIYSQVPFIDVAPPTLKKFVTGSGAAKKDQMRLAVYKKWDYEHDSDNVVDAYALARLGLAYGGVAPAVTKAEKEALKKVRESSPKYG